MVCLNSRRFVYVFKNRIHDSKTFEYSNSTQKVRILLKKLGEIRKSSSYRDVRVFEYLSYRDFVCLKRVSRFKTPTNLFDLTRCSSFRVLELSRVNCNHFFFNRSFVHKIFLFRLIVPSAIFVFRYLDDARNIKRRNWEGEIARNSKLQYLFQK